MPERVVEEPRRAQEERIPPVMAACSGGVRLGRLGDRLVDTS